MKTTLFQKIKSFVFRKRIIIPFCLIVLVMVFNIARRDPNPALSLFLPTYGTLVHTVSATGQVTSNTDLNLSFNKQGIVRNVAVSVGDKVTKDQVLVSLDGRQEQALVMQARAALLSAEAKLKRTGENTLLADVFLANANRDFSATKLAQDTLVANAYHTLLNSKPEAFVKDSNTNDYESPVITGTYKLGKEGVITLTGYSSSGGSSFTVSGLTTGSGMMTRNAPQPIGDSGLYITFPTTNLTVSEWTIPIPNTKASDYLANLNAYHTAIKNRTQALAQAQALVDQRTAELSVKKKPSFSSDTDLARADVLSAQGGFDSAIASYEDTVIRAPADGTITKVDIKYGERADASTPVITLQDIDNLYVESLVNESNIATLALGQSVYVSVDALGPSQKFKGTIIHIDPSSVTNDGVVNYKVKISFTDKNPLIRPGMNAEVVITTASKPEVLSVPKAALISRDGKSFLAVMTDDARKKYVEREVTTGMIGDGNRIEITSGITRTDHLGLITKK